MILSKKPILVNIIHPAIGIPLSPVYLSFHISISTTE